MTAFAAIVALLIGLLIHNVVYDRFWSRGVNVEMFFSSPTATEGDELVLFEVLSNGNFLPLPWAELKFQTSRNLEFRDKSGARISDGYYRRDLFSIMMRQKITRRLRFVCLRRGYYTVRNIDFVSGNLLMTKKYAAHFASNAAVSVYPKLMPSDAFDILYTRVMGAVVSQRFINPDPFEFKGIREYQPFDTFRSINFKAAARTGELMVNIHDYTVSTEVILMLNLQWHNDRINESLDEQSIRLAASLAERFIAQGVPVRFVTNGQDIITNDGADVAEGSGSGHLFNIYEVLARIKLANDPPAFANTLIDIGSVKKGEPLYLLISTYHRADLASAFLGLSRYGAKAEWILPYLPYTLLNVLPELEQKVTLWEASS
ncbi:MAG: DUF58 domain-containing protein [Clostridiales bacterium]|jgi:uncharacterized protein (DUF58 family)|nr:DUF58 domain-containing protein [Clostridiales bacterium]